MFFDILSLIIIVIFAIIGVKNGAAKVVCRILSVAAAFVLAVFLSHFLAELVYNTFIKQTITESINSAVINSYSGSAAEKAVELLSNLPVLLSNVLAYFGVSEASVAAMLSSSASNALEAAVMTPVVGIISVIFFIILFIAFRFLLNKVFSAVAKVFRLPVIRVLDSFLGVVFGVVEGFLLLWVFALVLRLVIPLTNGSFFVFSESYLADSVFFSLLYFGDISELVQGFIYKL